MDIARGRAEIERLRAGQAAVLVARHEQLLETAKSEGRRALHTRMAAIHRKLEQRHRTAAQLHDRYAVRLEKWIAVSARQVEARPRFMGVVAAELGTPSAGLTLLGPDRAVVSVIASDRLASAAQHVEFDLGEGPVHDVTRHGVPIIAELDTAPSRWPRYALEASRLGMRSVIAVPLVEATTCFGALAMFGAGPGVRPADLLARLNTMADALTHTMLLAGERGAAPDGPAGPLLAEQDQYTIIHQAVGMVAAQRSCVVEDALALIRARAFAENTPVDTIARRVIDRTVRFDD